MTDLCCFSCLASADVSHMSRHASLRSLLKISTSSLTSCMPSMMLKTAVRILCATILYHFSSFLISVKSNNEFQICLCLRRSSAVPSLVVNTMLASDCEIATVETSKLSIFAAFSALLILFHMSMTLIVV